MRVLTLVFCLVFGSSDLGALTPTRVTPAEIFDAIVQNAGKRRTRFTYIQTTQMMGMTIEGTGSGIYDLPRARNDLSYQTPIGEITLKTISDGKTLWQIEETPIGRRVVRHDISLSDGQNPIDPFMALSGVRTREFLDDLLSEFDATVRGIDDSGPVPFYVLDLKNRASPEVLAFQFRIGVDDAFPRGMDVFGPSGARITSLTVTDIVYDEAVDPAIFTYTPGPSDEVIEPEDLMAPDLEVPTTPGSLEGRDAPDFRLRDLQGNEVVLSALKGKHVLIDFWASWCPPCVRALPHIQALSTHGNGLVVLTVNSETRSVARAFVEENRYSFTTLLDADQAVSIKYGVTAIPTTFIISPDGKVAKHLIGYHTADQLRHALSVSGLSM